MYKRIFQPTLLVLFLVLGNLGHQVFSQAPDGFNYQAVIRDGAGALLANQTVTLQLSIRENTTIGNVLYSETHATTTNGFGQVNAVIGGGVPVIGSFASISWGANTHFLQVEADPGSGYVNLGTTQFISVPYALSAKYVENDLVDDADADPNNEIQTLSQSGNVLTLSQGGGTANIADSDWVASGNNIYNTTGNVGIGTNAPGSPLTVVAPNGPGISLLSGASGLTTFFGVGRTTFEGTFGVAGSSGQMFQDAVASDLCIKNFGSNPGRILFGSSFNAPSDMQLTPNGRLGINVNNPSYTLHVNGTAAKPGGGSWTATSDRRLKQNLNEFNDGLAQVMAIHPVRFHYNALSGSDTLPEYIGVIAQELQEVAPYMVGSFEKDEQEYLNVDPSAMVYLLINAVKEQQAQIDSLEAQILARDDENTVLMQRLQALEAALGITTSTTK